MDITITLKNHLQQSQMNVLRFFNVYNTIIWKFNFPEGKNKKNIGLMRDISISKITTEFATLRPKMTMMIMIKIKKKKAQKRKP